MFLFFWLRLYTNISDMKHEINAAECVCLNVLVDVFLYHGSWTAQLFIFKHLGQYIKSKWFQLIQCLIHALSHMRLELPVCPSCFIYANIWWLFMWKNRPRRNIFFLCTAKPKQIRDNIRLMWTHSWDHNPNTGLEYTDWQTYPISSPGLEVLLCYLEEGEGVMHSSPKCKWLNCSCPNQWRGLRSSPKARSWPLPPPWARPPTGPSIPCLPLPCSALPPPVMPPFTLLASLCQPKKAEEGRRSYLRASWPGLWGNKVSACPYAGLTLSRMAQTRFMAHSKAGTRDLCWTFSWLGLLRECHSFGWSHGILSWSLFNGWGVVLRN